LGILGFIDDPGLFGQIAVVEGGAIILLAASVFHFRILTIRAVKEFLRDKRIAVNLYRVNGSESGNSK
jgi:hypothetical protein